MGVPAGLLHGHDLLVDVEVAAGQEGAAVDDHVDLVGAVGDGVLHVGDLDGPAGAPAGERGGDGGDVDPAVAERLPGDAGEVAVDADRGDLGGVRVAGVGTAGLGGQRADLAGGVRALERGQVDHRDRRVDGPGLRRGLDRPRAEHGDAGLGAHLVDAGQAVQKGAECGVGARHVAERVHRRGEQPGAVRQRVGIEHVGHAAIVPLGQTGSDRVLLPGGEARG